MLLSLVSNTIAVLCSKICLIYSKHADKKSHVQAHIYFNSKVLSPTNKTV